MVDRYVAEWSGPFENYARAFALKNHWRVQYTMSLEDAVQCGAEVFARCLRYCAARGGKIDNDAWFMAIFKLALAHEFHTQALRCNRTRRGTAAGIALQGAASPGMLGIIISQASEDLRMVLQAVADAPAELLSMFLTVGEEARWSRRLCRLARIKVRDDLIAELKLLRSMEDN